MARLQGADIAKRHPLLQRVRWIAIQRLQQVPHVITEGKTIEDLADRIEDRAPEGPVLVMIGKVLAEAVEANVGRISDLSAEASAKAEAYSAVAS